MVTKKISSNEQRSVFISQEISVLPVGVGYKDYAAVRTNRHQKLDCVHLVFGREEVKSGWGQAVIARTVLFIPILVFVNTSQQGRMEFPSVFQSQLFLSTLFPRCQPSEPWLPVKPASSVPPHSETVETPPENKR